MLYNLCTNCRHLFVIASTVVTTATAQCGSQWPQHPEQQQRDRAAVTNQRHQPGGQSRQGRLPHGHQDEGGTNGRGVTRCQQGGGEVVTSDLMTLEGLSSRVYIHWSSHQTDSAVKC